MHVTQALDSYQALWEQLEDIDTNTQLLDPASALTQPYSNCSRCIALGHGASCQLKLSPTAPKALPSSVVFHGPSAVVAALQTSWYSCAHKQWQDQLRVRENLQGILQVISIRRRLQIAVTHTQPAREEARPQATVIASAGRKTGSGRSCPCPRPPSHPPTLPLTPNHNNTPRQVDLPPPKPGTRKGCAAVQAVCVTMDGSTAELQGSGDADTNSDSMDDDEEEDTAGACAICYALHLPDPSKPDELGTC